MRYIKLLTLQKAIIEVEMAERIYKLYLAPYSRLRDEEEADGGKISREISR